MTPQPFCCDITSGTEQERAEFKRLYRKASKHYELEFNCVHYGFDKQGTYTNFVNRSMALNAFTQILPLSEGIAILKQMVGEDEVKTTYTEQEIDFAYLAGVFNVSGIDGLYNEIQRLKSLGKHPHDIINEGRKHN